ncbi:antitoxin [Patescibacteria group bacterium]|nr:antitoxin [Patescibacteria group bacterium]
MKKKSVFNPFKNLVLDKYEQEIEDALNKGIIKPLPNSKQLAEKYANIAHAFLTKNRNVNLRISTQTYLGLKKKAAKLGLPYQTLAGSILHQYANL